MRDRFLVGLFLAAGIFLFRNLLTGCHKGTIIWSCQRRPVRNNHQRKSCRRRGQDHQSGAQELFCLSSLRLAPDWSFPNLSTYSFSPPIKITKENDRLAVRKEWDKKKHDPASIIHTSLSYGLDAGWSFLSHSYICGSLPILSFHYWPQMYLVIIIFFHLPFHYQPFPHTQTPRTKKRMCLGGGKGSEGEDVIHRPLIRKE